MRITPPLLERYKGSEHHVLHVAGAVVVRDDASPSKLFTLNQAIQRLRATHGESEEALSLTNHDHTSSEWGPRYSAYQ